MPMLNKDTAAQQMSILFPREETENREEITCVRGRFTQQEVINAVKKLNNKKSPGPDGIPAAIIKGLAEVIPWELVDVASYGLQNCVFFNCWKAARTVFLPKPGATAGQGEYRPISLINNMGKVVERLIACRLQEELEQKKSLHVDQYGFRKGYSTINAINRVTNWAAGVREGTWRTRRLPLMILLDIKNAFGSVPWPAIINALKRMNISMYLINQINHYLHERYTEIRTIEGTVTFQIFGGVPQGSVLGPLLWNIFYDQIFRLRYPEGVTIVGYADDVAILVEDREVENLEVKANQSLGIIDEWLESNKLQVSPAKSRCILFSGRRRVRGINIAIRGEHILEVSCTKYLGVMLDKSLKFGAHIEMICKRVAPTIRALRGMFNNHSIPRASVRRLITSAMISSALYAAPVWGEAMSIQRNKQRLRSVHRVALLGVVAGYRTLSYDALCVLAGVPPIELQIRNRRLRATGMSKTEAEAETRNNWQTEWSVSLVGVWTRRLIPDLEVWLERKHGNLDYYMTQLMSGHGSFGYYLHRFGKRLSPICIYCNEVDDVEHTIFDCRKWSQYRNEMAANNLTAENLVGWLLVNEANWDWFANFARNILRIKEEDSRRQGL